MLISVFKGMFGRSARRDAEGATPTNDAVEPSIALAIAAHAQGRFADVEHLCRQVLSVSSSNAVALHLLGLALHARGEREEAVDQLRASIALAPQSAEAHVHLAAALQDCGRLEQATAALEAAIALAPGLAAAHSALGAILRVQGRLEQAAGAFREAIRCCPELAQTWYNLGLVMRETQGDPAALEHLDRALALDPNFAEARHVQGQCLLGSGRFAEGWEALEARFLIPRITPQMRYAAYPLWQGEALADKRILVWGEQGVGDEIVFSSMYPELRERGAECVFECRPKLLPLFARSFPWASVASPARPTRDFDFQTPAGRLAKFLRTNLNGFPARDAFLVADPARTDYWRQRLAALPGVVNVGFSWRSSNTSGERAQACTRLDDWAPLFAMSGINWICLQYDHCEPELAAARARFGVSLNRFEEVDYFDDLDEVAALISALDLVISAPTTVSVQAAALGRPTWQMTFGADWQTHGTDRNPWLPALVRFHRRWNQRWSEIFDTVAARLRTEVATKA